MNLVCVIIEFYLRVKFKLKFIYIDFNDILTFELIIILLWKYSKIYSSILNHIKENFLINLLGNLNSN